MIIITTLSPTAQLHMYYYHCDTYIVKLDSNEMNDKKEKNNENDRDKKKLMKMKESKIDTAIIVVSIHYNDYNLY